MIQLILQVELFSNIINTYKEENILVIDFFYVSEYLNVLIMPKTAIWAKTEATYTVAMHTWLQLL